MTSNPHEKYRPFAPVALPDRRWPERTIRHAPTWCSVDLRDGNQALVEPMGPERKRRMFAELLRVGFREIEVGFPAASVPDFDFVRELVTGDCVPEGVAIQVLTQARPEQIDRTFESVRGARRVIAHLYNSTSTLQRRVVFGLDRAGIVEIAVRGAERVRAWCERLPDTEFVLEYSPESFTGTELDFAVEICEAVMDVWEPTPERRIILNLPATVELATPNVYADQIEWFGRHVRDRESIVLSVHPHNDRGTAVAAAELALMAGADRVEGTLFGNGERTGNVDVVTLALNLHTQGVDPGLDFSRIDHVREVVEHCNRLPVHPRHPYVGELVYTAFSGSHQDAIRKGFDALRAGGSPVWEVPYLPIDPADVGRSYEAVVRINSQSGKGGVAWVLREDHGYELPRGLQRELSAAVQAISERTGGEVTSRAVHEAFTAAWLCDAGPLQVRDHATAGPPGADGSQPYRFHLDVEGRERWIEGRGNGPIDAFVEALRAAGLAAGRVVDYHEHAVGSGADAEAVAYVEIADAEGRTRFGVGRHPSIVTASLQAVVRALHRLHTAGVAAAA